MASAPVSRPIWGFFLDRLAAWMMSLPAETSSYTVQTVQIPMRDGVLLAASLYQPTKTKYETLGTILVRGPYGRGILLAMAVARVYAARGYQVLFVSTRGTFGSQGTLDPGYGEAEDGQDTVTWMRTQSWYTGTFATLGASYLGFTQWALLADPPLDMVAAIIPVGMHDLISAVWGTGAFAVQQHLMWGEIIANQETQTIYEQFTAFNDLSRYDPIMKSVPLEPALRRHFGDKVPFMYKYMEKPDLQSDQLAHFRQGKALDKANIPILLITGWYDVFFEQTMEQYQALSQRGCPVALRIGPGGHIESQGADMTRESLNWLDKHLARKKSVADTPAVKIYRGGDSPEWLELPKWPPATTHRELFLAPGGKLENRQSDTADALSFTFDPTNPTPSVGGSLMFGAGSIDDSSLCAREDVITFTTDPLPESVDIFGRPSVDLVHSSDNPFCDLFVRLSVVDADGISRNVTEQYRQIDASREGKLVALDMPDTAYRVSKGSRIRLVVAGGCFPKFAPNLGSGESPANGTTQRPARHSVHFGGEYDSYLIFPVRNKTEN